MLALELMAVYQHFPRATVLHIEALETEMGQIQQTVKSSTISAETHSLGEAQSPAACVGANHQQMSRHISPE